MTADDEDVDPTNASTADHVPGTVSRPADPGGPVVRRKSSPKPLSCARRRGRIPRRCYDAPAHTNTLFGRRDVDGSA